MADNDASRDAQTDLKKRARRRLVGAAALALLAVVLLPILMDHEARPTSQEIQLHIPSIDSKAVLPAAPPDAPAPAGADSRPAAVSPAAPSAAVSSANTAAPPQAAAPSAAPPVAKPAQHDGEAAAPVKPADLANKNPPSVAASGEWIVRLGVYQSPANVKRLVAKLKEINVPSYTEKADVPQGPRTRVGAGPFASREAAEKAQAKIRKLGVEGSVADKQ